MEIVKAVKKRIVEIINPLSLNSKCSKIFAAFIVSLILLNVMSPNYIGSNSTAPEGIRTPGLRIRNPLLYPAELRAPIGKTPAL
jgi:energy-converting hydrogenase Eha subunit F